MFTKNYSINFSFSSNEIDSLSEEKINELKDDSIEIVFNHLKDGYTEGTLFFQDDEIEGSVVCFTGYWRIKENES